MVLAEHCFKQLGFQRLVAWIFNMSSVSLCGVALVVIALAELNRLASRDSLLRY